MLTQHANIEHSQQALARTLGEPHHTTLAIAAMLDRVQRTIYSLEDAVILVIPGDDLERAGTRGLVGHEVAQVLQEGLPLEQPLHQHLQLQMLFRRSDPRCDTPRHKSLLVGGNGAYPCHRAVRDDAHGVWLKELGNLILVVLNLVEGGEYVRLLVSRIL